MRGSFIRARFLFGFTPDFTGYLTRAARSILLAALVKYKFRQLGHVETFSAVLRYSEIFI